MKPTRKFSCTIIALLGVLCATLPTGAQEIQITNGVNWLLSHQDAPGLWGMDKKTPFRDAAAVVDILGRRGADTVAINRGLNAIGTYPGDNVDLFAREIIANLSAGKLPPFGSVDSLAILQNEDGGWGYRKGYGSNILETALALYALKRAGYANSTVLFGGVNYLTSKQNANGGWAFVGGDTSRVFFTAHVVLTLALLQDDFSVGAPIQSAVTWLKTQDKVDHGFGTGAASNPFETGLALAAIAKKEPTVAEVSTASTYLQSIQLGNGSWNDDAYRTAMAVFGLMHDAPDLAVAPSEITLSNPGPVDSDVVTISATIRNGGPRTASNVLVRFYDGHPDSGGVQIDSDITITSLAANSSSVKQVTWNGDSWSPLGGWAAIPQGINALAVYDSQVVAGGGFTSAEGDSANHIAAWTGSSWSKLDLGVDNDVWALTVYDGQLIAGGSFTTAGDIAAARVAAWNGSFWSPLGLGMNGDVRALTTYNGELIAGGTFTTAGGASANRIARWNGSSWSPLGSGMNGEVRALAVYDGQLIAGGAFTTAGGPSANRIARWNGSSWSSLGSGMNDLVYALTVYGGQLAAGGNFTTAGSVSANRIAAWNGTSWSSLGSGMETYVRALTVHNGRLIAGGDFITAGSASANRIAAWNGSSWSPLSSGMDSTVSALTVYDNQLIAGGNFTTAGDNLASSIAAWNTLYQTGDHQLYVIVDPLETISEPEEYNNIARKSVRVFLPPDLVIDQEDIIFRPSAPAPAQPETIQVTVWNTGEVTATDVPLQFWDGTPETGIPLLDTPFNIPSIAPGSGYQLNLDVGSYFAGAGDYLISVCADKNNELREVSEGNNCNNNTMHVGLSTTTITLSAGLNLLGMPLDPLASRTSFTLLPTIPNCKEISVWDGFTQRWQSAVDIGSSTIIGDEFQIGARDGFFARVTSAGSFGFLGRGVTQHETAYLQPGFNLVSVPNQNSCYTGYTLIGDITGCTQGKSWNAAGQAWLTANKSGSTYSGDNFPVVPGKGYFVKVPAAVDWITRSCDTLPPPVLPDLVFTTASIWLDPNPALNTEQVGIWLKLYNMGNDSAIDPLISVFKGDPSAGGQLLMQFTWPDTILAVDSSFWYGNYFDFPTPGSYEIYAVADRYNSMNELDETNNQAHATLTITAALSAPAMADGDAPRPVFVPVAYGAQEESAGVMLQINPRLLSSASPITETTITAAKPSETALAAGAASPAAPATAIAFINVTNLTSSSATVTWITDVHTDGCVNYGVSSVAEHYACETTPHGELHSIDLTDLAPSTTYKFEVVSGGITDNNGGAYYTFMTAAVGAGVPWVIYGNVLDQDSLPAYGMLVSATVRHGTTVSYLLSESTDPAGNWVLNLGNLKSPATHDVLAHSSGDTISLSVRAGLGGAADKKVLISGTSPQNAGTLKLAQVCDCGVFCDLNLDGLRNAIDVVVIVNYIYRAIDQRQHRPACFGVSGDWNCNGIVNAVDVVYMVNFVYKGSSVAPCDPCDCLIYPSSCPTWP